MTYRPFDSPPRIVRCLIVLFVSVSMVCLIAQPPVSLPVSMLGHEEGIENLGNWFCFKDSRGFVWNSSYSGLHRFDGREVKRYLPDPADSNSIKGIEIASEFAEDVDGNIWFGTERALHCYRYKTDDFTRYSLSPEDVGEYKVLGIDSAGAVWLTFDGTIYTFGPDRSFQEKATIDLNAMRGEVVRMTEVIFNNHNQVINTLSYGSYIDDPGLEIHLFQDGEMQRERLLFTTGTDDPLRIRDVHVLGEQTILIAALSGVYELDLQDDSVIPVSLDDQTACTGIAAFGDSTVLLAMRSGTYLEYNPHTRQVVERYILYFRGEAIHDPPTHISVDREGGVYIHVESRGLAFFHPGNLIFQHRGVEIDRDRGTLSIEFKGGMYEASEGRVLATTTNQGALIFSARGELLEVIDSVGPPGRRLPLNAINSCTKDTKGRIWIFHYAKFISRFDDSTLQTLRTFTTDQMLWGGYEHEPGNMIFLPRNGLLSDPVEQGSHMTFSVMTGMDTNKVYGGFAYHPNGLFVTSELRRAIMMYDPAEEYALVKTIPFERQTYGRLLFEDSDDFLIGTANGAYRYDSVADTMLLLDYCSCGTDGSAWYFIRLDKDRVLLASDNGLCMIDPEARTSYPFGPEHGLVTDKFRERGKARHSNGTIWLTHNEGIVTFRPEDLTIPDFECQVNITSVTIEGTPRKNLENADGQRTAISAEQSIKLPFATNTVSFTFAAFSYAGVDHFLYEYRMHGLEGQWTEGYSRGFARYTNLPPGSYVFEARVEGHPASLRALAIRIRPPLTARLWFQVILGAIALTGVYMLITYRNRRHERIRQLQLERRLALEQERVRIATDMHDDIGSGLSALNMRATVLAKRATGDMKTQLDKLADNSRLLTNQIREIIWTVNAQNDTLENLVTTLHQYAEEYFTHSAINCDIAIPIFPSDIPIEGVHRRQIYLAFKEILHNIQKHSAATRVQIEITISPDRELVVRVEDDGIGFDPDDIDRGEGIPSMRHRMEEAGGSCEVDSDASGTRVTLRYPLEEFD